MVTASAKNPGGRPRSGTASATAAATVQPIPYPGRYVVVKQLAIDRSDTHPLPDTTPLHSYNPHYLRLDLKTHSTRLLHNAIQQTSVDATPEHHATVVSSLVAAGVLPENALPAPPSPSSLQLLPNQRSCSIASAGKRVAFAETVLVCNVDDDDDDRFSLGGKFSLPLPPERPEPPEPPMTPVPQRSLFNVLQVYSQTGELVGDLLIERQREPPPPATPSPVNDAVAMRSPSTPSSVTLLSATPSPVDDAGRRKRHEMFCRRRQSPVYSCDDGETAPAATSATAVVPTSPDDGQHSVSSSSVYESCEELSAVVLGPELGRPPLSVRRHHRSAAAIRGYASCCPL